MEQKLTESKNIPLYLKVKDSLVEKIEKKIWPPNTLIPTEQELMEQFSVSRTTIREAVNLLVQDGLLEKTQGKGTIVKFHSIVGSLGKLKGFAEEVVEKGMKPKSKVIRSEFIKNGLYFEKSKLLVPDSEEILLIERIRFADDVPIAIERTCWVKKAGEILLQHDLEQAKFYEILENHDVFLKRAKEQISAINATILEADLLGIRGGEALLQMTRLSFGLNEKPIEFTKTKYRSDQYHYDLDLMR
jgi:GntR family transcriptional regulator